jgi:lipid-A-disaccharide synthase
MTERRPLKLAIVAGEESGDLLGADLVRALRDRFGQDLVLTGVGGQHLEAEGLESLFDLHEIALMGLSAILRNTPNLLRRIRGTADAVVRAKPDVLVIIDSPEFTHRVARKVRKADPSIPVVDYVCPSVWAWRPERARTMTEYVDHVLAILPFEVEALRKLHGPSATYVGHRLAAYPPILDVAERRLRRAVDPEREKALLLLPGSRRSEVTRLMEAFGETVDQLAARGHRLRLLLPTLERLEDTVRDAARTWQMEPEIVVGDEAKWMAFAEADAALAASGTVSLELALCRVPTVLCYKADAFARWFLVPRITIWSAALPNLIDDRPAVPEYFNEFVRPGMLARWLETLFENGPSHAAQMAAFERIAERMWTERPSGEIAAEAVLGIVSGK